MTNGEYLKSEKRVFCGITKRFLKSKRKFKKVSESTFIDLYIIPKNRQYTTPQYADMMKSVYEQYNILWIGVVDTQFGFIVLPNTTQEQITLFLLECDNF